MILGCERRGTVIILYRFDAMVSVQWLPESSQFLREGPSVIRLGGCLLFCRGDHWSPVLQWGRTGRRGRVCGRARPSHPLRGSSPQGRAFWLGGCLHTRRGDQWSPACCGFGALQGIRQAAAWAKAPLCKGSCPAGAEGLCPTQRESPCEGGLRQAIPPSRLTAIHLPLYKGDFAGRAGTGGEPSQSPSVPALPEGEPFGTSLQQAMRRAAPVARRDSRKGTNAARERQNGTKSPLVAWATGLWYTEGEF